MKKTVVVTGASSGLGLNVIKKLLNKDYKVYGLARNVEKIDLNHKFLLKVPLDLTDDESCKNALKKVRDQNNNLDILVNIAGTTVSGESLSHSTEKFKEVLDVNVLGMFNMVKHFVKNQSKSGNAKIVNITSMTGLVAFPNFGLYSASKSAQEALGITLRYELLKENISVTNIAPGAIEKKEDVEVGVERKTAREKFGLLQVLMPIQKSDYVATKIVSVIEQENPPARLILGRDAKIIYLLHKILPFSLFDKLMLYVWKKK